MRKMRDSIAGAPTHASPSQERRDACLFVLRRLTRGPSAREALDLGCGTGLLSLLLAELGDGVEEPELAAALLARARLKAAALEVACRARYGQAASTDRVTTSSRQCGAVLRCTTSTVLLCSVNDSRHSARRGGVERLRRRFSQKRRVRAGGRQLTRLSLGAIAGARRRVSGAAAGDGRAS